MAAPTSGAFWVVIPAAGAGSRFGGEIPKQYQRIGGRTILERTLQIFLVHGGARGILLALAADDPHWAALDFPGRSEVRTVAGGAERCHSVLNALRVLEKDADALDLVLVHDAARPCLSQEALSRLVTAAYSHPVGALLAVPVADTLKRANPDNEVAGTQDRSGLWQAQTPQMFRYRLLRDALEDALTDAGGASVITDESSAMEAAGHKPLLVPGDPANLKITRSADLDLAARILGV